MTKSQRIVRREKKRLEKDKLSKMSKYERKEYLALKKYKRKLEADNEYEKYNREYLEKVSKKKNSKMNGWFRLWFNLGQADFFQWFRKTWKKFYFHHTEGAKLIYQIFYFVVFSEGVTIWQYLLLTFLPMTFGLDLAGTEFMWPSISMGTYNGTELFYNILGYTVNYDASGNVIVGGGLGYFLAFEIATFTAQCINFPLQRNITYRSHGNPWYQALWYFIGWLLISFACNAVNGAWIPFAQLYLTPAVYNLLVMVATGGISMVIFFFVFRIIFPEGEPEKKVTKK